MFPPGPAGQRESRDDGWREAEKAERKESAGHFSGAVNDSVSLSYNGWKSGDSGMGSAKQHKRISIHKYSHTRSYSNVILYTHTHMHTRRACQY